MKYGFPVTDFSDVLWTRFMWYLSLEILIIELTQFVDI